MKFWSYLIFLAIIFQSSHSFAGNKAPQDSLEVLAGEATGDHIVLDYGVTSVNSGTYVELVASLTNKAKRLEILDTSGSPVLIAIGAAGSEVDKAIIQPGGNEFLFIDVPATTRIAVKAQSTGETISSGRLYINFYGQQ